MDDIKKAYYDELKEKSVLARSAKTGLRRSRYWKTNYTKKELEAMNGPTYRINPNEFMPYTEFKALPDTLKKEYLQTVIDNWNIGAAAIAKMWGITAGTSCPLMKRLGVKTNGKRSSAENTDRFFAEFVQGTGAMPSIAQTKKMTFCDASISFTGVYDEQSLIQQLRALIPAGVPITLAVSVTAVE